MPKRDAFRGARSPRERRPDFDADRRRRRAFVKRELREHGMDMGDGTWAARCQVCGESKALPLRDWWADHIDPVAGGGPESGPLRLSCKACQVRQGSRVANARNPLAQPRRRPEEPHPGVTGR